MKAQWQKRASTYMTCVLWAWGCSVYQPNVLGDQLGSSAGGTPIGAAGETSSAGRGEGSAGAAATASSGAGGSSGVGTGGVEGIGGSVSPSGAAGTGGAEGIGGSVSPLGGAGESSTFGGAATGGEAGAPACVPETTSEFCKRLGNDCGAVDAADNCGRARVVASCGSCQGFKLCGGGGQNNLCGALTDPAMGGMATASSVGSVGENGSKAFDLSATSKWYAGDGNATGWLAYQFAGTTAHVVQSYSLTSANDVPQRDPSAWQLQGSNNGASWVTVDQRSLQVFANRAQTNSYTCSGVTPYRWYRLLITANSGATALQLAELVLYGS